MQAVQLFLHDYKPLIMVLYLSLTGMACVMAAMAYLGAPPDPVAGLTFMGFVFFIYIINRFTDLQEDFANDIGKAMFFARHKSLLKVGIGALVLAVMALAALNKLSLIHVVLITAGILYSYRFIPWYKKGKGLVYCRIKELPLVKNLAVSILWGLSIVCIPMLFSGAPLQSPFLVSLIIISIIVSTFNNTLFGDITDIVGDSLSRTATLPTLLGKAGSYRILWSVNGVWIAFLASFSLSGGWDIFHSVFFGIIALYPFVYIIPFKRGWLSKHVVDVLMEFDLLIIACGLALLSLSPRF